jgi:hypothetical protein
MYYDERAQCSGWNRLVGFAIVVAFAALLGLAVAVGVSHA